MGIRVWVWCLSVVCVLVAWREVWQMVWGCFWSIGWIVLPSHLFLPAESWWIGQLQYNWGSCYATSTPYLSEEPRMCWIMECLNEEEPPCWLFYPIFQKSLMMHIMYDNDAWNDWRRIWSFTMEWSPVDGIGLAAVNSNSLPWLARCTTGKSGWGWTCTAAWCQLISLPFYWPQDADNHQLLRVATITKDLLSITRSVETNELAHLINISFRDASPSRIHCSTGNICLLYQQKLQSWWDNHLDRVYYPYAHGRSW